MSESFQILAPAKVNLRLEVLGRLENGFHLLRMFNLTVSLFDVIELEFQDRGIEIEIDDSSIPADRSNTVFRAVSYFKRKYNFEFGLKIRIKKRIPAGAGLGGGSSDAGRVLLFLVNKFGLKVSELNPEEIAYQIGADVPYLLHGGPAWVEGIGEKVEVVSGFPERHYLLVKPEYSISTREVYENFLLEPDLTISEKQVILSQVNFGNWKDFCVNHLEKVVFKKHLDLKKLKSEIIRLGAEAVVMSGSGSTLVGIFSTKEQAERAGKGILRLYPNLWVQLVKEEQPRMAIN